MHQPTAQQNDGEDLDGSDRNLTLPPIRGRLATIGAYGRTTPTKEKDEADGTTTKKTSKTASHLRRQNSFPRRGKSKMLRELNYLSPDMELKIQQMIQQALGTKYGGLDKATKAAIVIQRAYRQHKMDTHFQKLRKLQQDTMFRRRTMSINTSHHVRKPSMIRSKRPLQSSAPTVDLMDDVRNKYKNIKAPRMSPKVSRRDIQKSSLSIKQQPVREEEVLEIHTPLEEDTPIFTMSPLTMGPSTKDNFTMIGVVNEDSMLTKAYSADDLESRMNQPSVFTGMSMQKIHELFPSQHPVGKSTIEDDAALRRKFNIGANIFNRSVISL